MRSTARARFAIIGLVLACVVLAFSAMRHYRPAASPPTLLPAPKKAAVRRPDAGFRFEGTTLKVLTPGTGALEWELSAKSIDVSQTKGVTQLSQLTARYHDAQGVLSEVRAGEATLESSTRSLHFTGKVVVTARSGAKLTSDAMHWDGRKSLYTADNGVRLESDGTVLTGSRVVADGGLKRVKISGNVRVKGAGRLTK